MSRNLLYISGILPCCLLYIAGPSVLIGGIFRRTAVLIAVIYHSMLCIDLKVYFTWLKANVVGISSLVCAWQ